MFFADEITRRDHSREFAMGRPDYGGGRRIREHEGERSLAHTRFDPATHVDKLQGHLMFMYGDVDVQCPPPQLLALLGSFADAGKDVDVVPFPGQSHYYTRTLRYQKRMWDYFLEHLHGRTPLKHFELPVAPYRGVRNG